MADTVLTTTIIDRAKLIGGIKVIIAELAFSAAGTYNSTSKIAVTAAQFELVSLENLIFLDSAIGGYVPWYDRANKRFSLYGGALASHSHAVALDGGVSGAEAAHTHAVALDGGASGAGASHNHAFTGTAPLTSLDLATPAFSGTGLTAAGQVMTTTDNQTMTLNQCAGMWLKPAAGASALMLILSNTAVTGAPAVLTVQGVAATDAGAYKIVTGLAPGGTNAAEATHTHASGTLADAASGVGSSHTHGAGTLVDAASGASSASEGALDEVDNAVNISTAISTKKLRVIAIGV